MKVVPMILATAALVCLLVTGLQAGGQQKEVTLKGKILCAMCALKETKTCQTAIQVKEDKKTVTYYFDDKGPEEKYHETVCGGGEGKAGTVVGTVTEKDGKKLIRPKKVEYAK